MKTIQELLSIIGFESEVLKNCTTLEEEFICVKKAYFKKVNFHILCLYAYSCTYMYISITPPKCYTQKIKYKLTYPLRSF